MFAEEAFIQSPPTLDHGVLVRLLDDVHLADEMRIEDGTAMGSGMATAANMLKDSNAESKLVTLITDGVNNAGEIDPITVATAAESLGIKLYTIGVGSPGSGVVSDENPLDEEMLQEIADISKCEVLPGHRHRGAEEHLRGDQRTGEVRGGGAAVHA